MTFNKTGKTIKKYIFSINNTRLENTDSYKYLGIIFKPSGVFTAAVKHLISKAKKATFSIRNIFPQNRLSFIQNIKLFDACIKPILLYNSEVWGPEIILHDRKSLDKCLLSFMPENIHIKFIKYILGVNRSAVNMAVLAETGRFPIAIHTIKTIIRYFFHIIQAPDTSLIKRIYTESLEQKNTFIKKVENLFNILGFSHVWENQGTFSISRLEKAMINKLKEKYVNFWKETRNENSCAYNQKLRTYNTF